MASPCRWSLNISSSWFGSSSRYTRQSPFPSSTRRSVTILPSLPVYICALTLDSLTKLGPVVSFFWFYVPWETVFDTYLSPRMQSHFLMSFDALITSEWRGEYVFEWLMFLAAVLSCVLMCILLVFVTFSSKNTCLHSVSVHFRGFFRYFVTVIYWDIYN